MSNAPSILSLLAAGLYALVTFACLAGLSASRKRSQAKWHTLSWAALALLFILLLSMRVTGLEDILRETARAILREEGAFQNRRSLQAIIVSIFVIFSTGLGGWLVYKAYRGSRKTLDIVVKLANGAGLTLAALLLLRLISLHAIDSLLYGPLKLNWLTDVGASLCVLGLAVFYVRNLRFKRKTQRK